MTLVVANGSLESDPVTTTVSIRATPVAPLARTAAIVACGAPGATVRLHSHGTPLAPVAGGFDFGAGLPPPGVAARPEATVPVSLTGAAGTTALTGAVDAVETNGGVEQTIRAVVSLPTDLAPGNYQVSVDGATAISFAVPCPPETELRPRAVAGGPYQGVTGAPISLDGSGSSAPGGGTLEYLWDLGDGETASGATPQHAWAEPGTYLVTLVVNDGIRSSIPMVRGASFTTVVVAAAPDPGGAAPATCGCGLGRLGGTSTVALLLATVLLLGMRRRGRPGVGADAETGELADP